MSIKVRFFASLREQIGRAELDLPVDGIATVGDVWAAASRGAQPPSEVLAAVNHTTAGLDASVKDGDEVGFFPPVTGG
ncbi:MAG: MoaD/ThiS family protein [Pseudomonadota bacterium]